MTELIEQIVAYEMGDLDEDATVSFFQQMINDGSVWGLQGHYIRTAKNFLDVGLCQWPVKTVEP